MHITIPATRYSRMVSLSLNLKGWSIILQDDPYLPSGPISGLCLVMYGPLFGRYPNGARGMFFRWQDGVYTHHKFGVRAP